MEILTILGLTFAGIFFGGSIVYYCIRAAQKERKRKQLLSMRNYSMV